MRRIEFKAYGGTGSLICRSFITLMAMNAGNFITQDGKYKDDKCIIYTMDYDDEGDAVHVTDGSYLKTIIQKYNLLHSRGLEFIAPIALEESSLSLKSVRNFAYGTKETTYSLDSLFCTGIKGNEIKQLLTSAFTSDPNSATQEIERSNANGCYGDLAVNGFISEKLMATKAFSALNAYNDLSGNIDNAVVIYAGSTDGGTANTMIDKDIESLIEYLASQKHDVGTGRRFKIYGLRTTPYSKFSVSRGGEQDIEITEDILRDKFEMSKGVFENIQNQNNEALADSSLFSYYYLDNSHKYWLDGLFIASSSVLDQTNDMARKDNQFHPSHFVEFALAAQAMDALSGRLPSSDDNIPHLYAYNDGADNAKGDKVNLSGFFGKASVNYNFKYYTMEGNSNSIPLSKYIRAVFLTLVTIKSDMIDDFRNYSSPKTYIKDIFHKAEGAMSTVCPCVANELVKFIDEAKFIVMCMTDMIDYSKFGKQDSTIHLVEEAVRYLYSEDNFGCPIPATAIHVDASSFRIEKGASNASILNRFSSMPFKKGSLGGKKLKSEDVYRNEIAEDVNITGRNIANNMIRRLFEVYVRQIKDITF